MRFEEDRSRESVVAKSDRPERMWLSGSADGESQRTYGLTAWPASMAGGELMVSCGDMPLLAQTLQPVIAHEPNFVGGWCLVLVSFALGAIIGLGFHRDDFLGGYTSFRRRLLRLGHIALAALGIVNIVFGLSPVPAVAGGTSAWPGWCLLGGGVAMPAVCFLTAWKPAARHLFFIPVTLLVLAAVLMVYFGVNR